MDEMQAKVKHMEMIQTIIARMSQGSFLLKGWALTVVAGTLSVAFKEAGLWAVTVPLCSTIAFWFLDARFLRQERLFRYLFDAVATDVRSSGSDVPLFSMNTKPFSSQVDGLLKTALSGTLLLFYGALVATTIVVGTGVILQFTKAQEPFATATPTCGHGYRH